MLAFSRIAGRLVAVLSAVYYLFNRYPGPAFFTCCGPACIDYGLSYSPEGDHYFRQQGLLMRVDTVSVSSPLPQPEMVWRGRPLNEYEDWRAGKHVDIIRYFGR